MPRKKLATLENGKMHSDDQDDGHQEEDISRQTRYPEPKPA